VTGAGIGDVLPEFSRDGIGGGARNHVDAAAGGKGSDHLDRARQPSLRVCFGDGEPGIAKKFENRAFAYLKMGEFERAIADYDAGLRLDPPNKADFLYGRGLARLKKGDGGGNADVAAAKALHPKIAEEFASYGLR